MVAIIDYDAGNIKSVEKAFRYLGQDVIVSRDKNEIFKASHVVLPGVGAFGDAMSKLNRYGLIPVIKEAVEKDMPFLGICLGLQLLFESSEESKGVEGLSLMGGEIVKIPEGDGLKVPHIGWNDLTFTGNERGRLFKDLPEHPYVYFVHSYYLKAKDRNIVKARTSYGVEIDASVERKNAFACQFHPEKSADTGMSILKNFLEI